MALTWHDGWVRKLTPTLDPKETIVVDAILGLDAAAFGAYMRLLIWIGNCGGELPHPPDEALLIFGGLRGAAIERARKDLFEGSDAPLRFDGTVVRARADLRGVTWTPEPLEREPVPPGMRRKVLERDGYQCRRCGADDPLHVDHIHPVAHGGRSTMNNLQTLCRPCNLRKGAKLEASRGR